MVSKRFSGICLDLCIGVNPPEKAALMEFCKTVRYKTVRKGDVDFQPLLQGTFATALRAIPIQSLNINTVSEEITFKLVEADQIQKPSSLRIWCQLVRPLRLSLTLNPLISIILIQLQLGAMLNWFVVISSSLAAVCWQLSGQFLSDYFDYMSGADRLDFSESKNPLRFGWITAIRLKHIGIVFLVFGISLGIPALLGQPLKLVGVGSLAVVGLWLFSSRNNFFRKSGLSEALLFLLMGPMLTFGFTWAIGGHVSNALFWVAMIYGSLAMLKVFVDNVADIFVDAQAGVETLATKLGFDRSQRAIQWLGFFALSSATGLALSSMQYIGLALIVTMGGFLIILFRVVLSCGSFATTSMARARSLSLCLHFVTGVVLNILLFLALYTKKI